MSRTNSMIREAVEDDLDDIVKLWYVLIDHHGELDPVYRRSGGGHLRFREWVSASLDAPDYNISLATENGEAVGYCITSVKDYPPVFNIERYAYITDLAVHPDHRRKGHGRALAENALSWARSVGVPRVELRVHSKNPSGLEFWREMGFSEYVKVMYQELP